MDEASLLELKNVKFSYGQQRDIIKDANISFNKGSINGIIGISGSGKTTLIRLMNGSLLKDGHYKYDGDIYLMDKELKNHKDINRVVGTVYQDPDNQIIFTKVRDELVFGMENYNQSLEYMKNKLTEIVELLDIKHLLDRDPNQLSGGEKQLVVLASMLTLDVDILILDECMTGISTKGRIKVLRVIEELKKQGKCIILVEHDFENLLNADQIYEIADGVIQLVNYEELIKG